MQVSIIAPGWGQSTYQRVHTSPAEIRLLLSRSESGSLTTVEWFLTFIHWLGPQFLTMVIRTHDSKLEWGSLMACARKTLRRHWESNPRSIDCKSKLYRLSDPELRTSNWKRELLYDFEWRCNKVSQSIITTGGKSRALMAHYVYNPLVMMGLSTKPSSDPV